MQVVGESVEGFDDAGKPASSRPLGVMPVEDGQRFALPRSPITQLPYAGNEFVGELRFAGFVERLE